jgi:hypothetical protein
MRESYPLRRYMQGFAMILDEAVVKEIFMYDRVPFHARLFQTKY